MTKIEAVRHVRKIFGERRKIFGLFCKANKKRNGVDKNHQQTLKNYCVCSDPNWLC